MLATAVSTAPTMDTALAAANGTGSDILESDVIESIRAVASSGANITRHPRRFLSDLGGFGRASGALVGQKWLTPEALDECVLFWDDGYRALMRDLFRSYLFSTEATRYRPRDWAALFWFGVLATSSSVLFLPLLLPLVRTALEGVGENGIDEAVYVPPSFGRARRAAMRRLRRPREPPLERFLGDGAPRDAGDGIAFFRDGTTLLVRDARRGALTSRERDTWGSYALFALLAFSSFPLTPLVVPLIDKRRTGEGERTSDYVPSSYRPERRKALTRLRGIAATRFGTTPVDTLRAVATASGETLPPPEALLAAILRAQRGRGKGQSSSFLDALAGTPGRRWQLAYVAGKPAVMAMRKRLQTPHHKSSRKSQEDPNGVPGGTWYRALERLLLPWTRLRDGTYVDSDLCSAIQNFDAQSMQNKNGVFGVLKSDFFQASVEGPFSWDGECEVHDYSSGQRAEAKRRRGASVCAFRPTTAAFQLGPWWKIEQDLPEERPFSETHIRDLPFFKFIHVDDKVAVAMGRSGGVALWTRMAETSEVGES